MLYKMFFLRYACLVLFSKGSISTIHLHAAQSPLVLDWVKYSHFSDVTMARRVSGTTRAPRYIVALNFLQRHDDSDLM